MKYLKANKLSYELWCRTRAEGEMLTDGENFYTEWPEEGVEVDEAPKYLSATVFKPISLSRWDVDAWMESAAEEHHEDILENVDTILLEDAVTAWNEAHKTVGSWFEDPARVVLPPPWAEGSDEEDDA